jgi:hypothetical protein
MRTRHTGFKMGRRSNVLSCITLTDAKLQSRKRDRDINVATRRFRVRTVLVRLVDQTLGNITRDTRQADGEPRAKGRAAPRRLERPQSFRHRRQGSVFAAKCDQCQAWWHCRRHQTNRTSSLLHSLAFLYETLGVVLNAVEAVTANNNIFVYGISDGKVGGLKVRDRAAMLHPSMRKRSPPTCRNPSSPSRRVAADAKAVAGASP